MRLASDLTKSAYCLEDAEINDLSQQKRLPCYFFRLESSPGRYRPRPSQNRTWSVTPSGSQIEAFAEDGA